MTKIMIEVYATEDFTDRHGKEIFIELNFSYRKLGDMNKKINQLLKRYGKEAQLVSHTEGEGFWSTTTYKVLYKRLETDEEYEKRLQTDEIRKNLEEERELAELERLKAKYRTATGF